MKRHNSPEEVVVEVFNQLNIKTIVCIDDWYSSHSKIEVIIGWLAKALVGGQLSECSSLFPDIPFNADNDEIWKSALSDEWSRLTPEERELKSKAIGISLGYLDDRDDRALAQLDRYLVGLPGAPSLVSLTPDQWIDQKSNIVESSSPDERVLCLFDQDLTGVGLSDQAGIELLQETTLTSACDEERVYCGLLSHNFSPSEEEVSWRQVEKEHGVSLEKFLPISKQRLEDPFEFAHAIKLSAMNRTSEQLKGMARDVIDEARAYSADQLNDLTVNDFDHVIVRSSQEEGVWEIYTLFRIFGIFEYRARRDKALEVSRRQAFTLLTKKLRNFGSINTSLDKPPSSRIWAIRRTELYDENYINQQFQPVELGDIFESDEQKLILMAQPCDLVLRSDGVRKLRSGTLIPIIFLAKRPEASEAYAECPYFSDDAHGRWYLDFQKAVDISLDVLDLATFREDGECRFHLSGQMPDDLFHPWKFRYNFLSEKFNKLMKVIEHTLSALQAIYSTEENQKEVLDQLLSVFSLEGDSFTPKYSEREFIFSLRRVGRLLEPLASDLLTRYETFRARRAFDHDFAKDLSRGGTPSSYSPGWQKISAEGNHLTFHWADLERHPKLGDLLGKIKDTLENAGCEGIEITNGVEAFVERTADGLRIRDKILLNKGLNRVGKNKLFVNVDEARQEVHLRFIR